MIVEILLGVGGFYMNRGAELNTVDAEINVQKGDVRGGSVPGGVQDSDC